MVSIIATYRAFPHSTPNTTSSLPPHFPYLFPSLHLLLSIIRSIFRTYTRAYSFFSCAETLTSVLSRALGKTEKNLCATKFCISFNFIHFITCRICTEIRVAFTATTTDGSHSRRCIGSSSNGN